MSDILNIGIKAAKDAGMLLACGFGKAAVVESKGDRNLVTQLDKKAEEIIISQIKSVFPGHGIIAEESGRQNADSDYVWVIDPMDGTHNFIHSVKIFGVSIGVMHREEFVAGIIYMPLDNELYIAERGSGAYKNDGRIHVSSKGIMKECLVGFDSTIRGAPENLSGALKSVATQAFSIRMVGSSARVLSYVAEGVFDASVEFFDYPWDFAAGACLVREAGGMITCMDGSPLTIRTQGYIASNGLVQGTVQSLVAPYLLG